MDGRQTIEDHPQGQPYQSSWPDRPAGPPPPRHSHLGLFKELPILILIAFGLALLIKTFLIQAFFIPSGSMEPTLAVNDRILVNRLAYRFREPQRGEVIVFVAERDLTPRSTWQRFTGWITEGLGVSAPMDRDFVKRVIGLPGETIEYREGVVRITQPDGSLLHLTEDDYTRRDMSSFGPFTVPEDSYFVMGDNRPNSADSRGSLGPVKREDVIGKVFVRIWPLSRLHTFTNPMYGAPQPPADVEPAGNGEPAGEQEPPEEGMRAGSRSGQTRAGPRMRRGPEHGRVRKPRSLAAR